MCFLSIFRGRGKPQFSWLCNQQSCINWPLMYNLQASRIKLLISSACSPMFMAVTQLPGSTGAGEPSFSTIFFMLETVSSEFHWFSQCSRWLKASLHIVSYPCHCRDSHRTTFLEKALLENLRLNKLKYNNIWYDMLKLYINSLLRKLHFDSAFFFAHHKDACNTEVHKLIYMV